MGTKMAPSYANLFMGYLEQEFLASYPIKPLLWKRYIDDGFLLWQHGEEALIEFMECLNHSFSVNFTYEFSNTNATFLDVNLSLNSSNHFDSSIHLKTTNKQQYLHFDSCHPPHCKLSIPFSLSIRAHRICSTHQYKDQYLTNLHAALQNRGYPPQLLQKRILPASCSFRPRNKISHSPPPTNLLTTYFPGVEKLKPILNSLYPIISNNSLTKNLLPKPPTLVYKRPPNLLNIFNNAPPTTPSGTHTCNRPRCKTCRLVDSSCSLISPNTPNSYKISTSANCTTSNLIYNLKCQKCEAFYVGETMTPFSIRMSGHRDSIAHKPYLPVAVHTRSHGTTFDECFHAQVIRALPENTSRVERLAWESSYIEVLKAAAPPGLNKKKC